MRVIEHAAEAGLAGEAAQVVDPEPLVEKRRRMPIEQPWPDQRPRCEGEEGPGPGAPARAPVAECEQRDRGEREHARTQEALRQEGDSGTRAEEKSRAARESGEAEEDPRRKQRVDPRVALHAGCTTAFRSSPSSASASVSFSSSFCAQDSSAARLRRRISSAFW